MELKDLVGLHFLSGVQFGSYNDNDFHASTIDFIIDGKILSAIEDPSDGYRSYMNSLIERSDIEVRTKFKKVKVLGVLRDNDPIIDFIDCKSAKIILSIGTDYSDDYYPSFVSNWIPENMHINRSKK